MNHERRTRVKQLPGQMCTSEDISDYVEKLNASRRTRTFDPLIKSQQSSLANKGVTAGGVHVGQHSKLPEVTMNLEYLIKVLAKLAPDQLKVIRAILEKMIKCR